MSTLRAIPDAVLLSLMGTALGRISTTWAVAGELHFSQTFIEVANPTRYAIERSSTYISIYFWERGSSSVPNQVRYPGGTVDTSTWVIDSYRRSGQITDTPGRARPRLISQTQIVISHLILDQ